MKRVLSFLIVSVLMPAMFAICASAENSILKMQYVPRTERGALFYVDVSCEKTVSAGVFELGYDAAAVEYRDVSVENDNAAAMGDAENGTAKIAFSHRSGMSGKLYRVAFKALKTGTARFTLHLTQATDGELNYLSGIPDCSLEIRFGKDDIVEGGQITVRNSAGSSGSSDKSSGKSSDKTEESSGMEAAKSDGGAESSLSIADDDSADTDETTADDNRIYDYSGSNNKVYFFAGGAAVIFAGLLIATGFILGKKLRKKPIADTDTQPEEADRSEENETE